ncbi:MAG TPA: urease accessory UreF family protein, partial [Stellaceae bacterium]|nr:urease accessory UreF family protein [Stellaceae bacterium]
MSTIMSTIMTTEFAWLIELTSWLSPSYPVGGFGFSHGLEWAVEAGQVTDRETLGDYVATSLEAGGGWTDLVLAAASWRAAADGDDAALDELAALAAALRGTSELALETTSQGAAFIAATCAAWPGTALDALAARHGPAIAYPVAVGAACGGRIPLDATLV